MTKRPFTEDEGINGDLVGIWWCLSQFLLERFSSTENMSSTQPAILSVWSSTVTPALATESDGHNKQMLNKNEALWWLAFSNVMFKNTQGSPLPRSGSTRRQGNLVLPRVYSDPHSTPWEKSFAFNLRVLESSLLYKARQSSFLNIAAA